MSSRLTKLAPVETTAEDLLTIRSHIAAKAAERAAVAQAPRSAAAVADAIRSLVDAAEANAREYFLPEALMLDPIGDPNLAAVFRRDIVGGLAMFLGADEMTKRLVAEAATVAKATGHKALTSAARAIEYDRIDQEIFDLSVEEELLIRRAERSGVKLDRRSDAPPAIVLATNLESA